MINKLFALVTLTVLLASCGEQKKVFEKTPLDELIQSLSNENSYSIVLNDMDYDEGSETYKHKYQVLLDKPDTVTSYITDWKKVSEQFFNTHIDNLGMEVASKKDGKLTKTVAPPGYSNYVGNEKYGHWVDRGGDSFWEFYGKFAFMSSMINLATFPIRYSYWNDYHRNYYGYGRPYYGPTNFNGGTMYGTNGAYNSGRETDWNRRPNTFKQNVREKVARSSSGSFYSSRKNKSSDRVSRGSSRYNSSSGSFRSRGGGFGK